jgi:hypothetical protein
MNEMQFGNKLRQLLNQGLRLNGGIEQRLRAAREQALARQRPEPAPVVAWADNVLGRLGGWSGLSLRLLVPLAMLLVAFAALYTWQQNQRADELAEIDAQLLTDDLPIDAFLDRGFQHWLKKRAADE